MKCKDCNCAKKGFFSYQPEAYVCTGVKEPFVIGDINAECTEYESKRNMKMTREEAIKKLEYIRYVGNGEQEYKNCAEAIALDMAIADMEKQIPKKPNRHEEDIIGEYYSCPNCMNNELDDIFDNYCSRCGQALDWSEEND